MVAKSSSQRDNTYPLQNRHTCTPQKTIPILHTEKLEGKEAFFFWLKICGASLFIWVFSFCTSPLMGSSSAACIILFCLSSFASMRLVLSSSVWPLCPHQSSIFLNNLQSQCPFSISPGSPLQVDGNFLDRTLTSKQRKSYTSVLFYGSWCPFSHKMHSTFDLLSSMFPQIEHLAIEQSSAIPSVFSRYGIHSFPSILMVNQTSRVQYRGPKNLFSLVQFYKKTTGLEPVQYIADDQSDGFYHKKAPVQSTNRSSVIEMLAGEPYLVFAVLFLCLRIFTSIFPEVLSSLRAFWVSYIPHLNLEIFGERSQILSRLLYMIDLRRVWTKLRLCKTRNFHEGAKNARVWASSLASVSLGKSSSTRS